MIQQSVVFCKAKRRRYSNDDVHGSDDVYGSDDVHLLQPDWVWCLDLVIWRLDLVMLCLDLSMPLVNVGML